MQTRSSRPDRWLALLVSAGLGLTACRGQDAGAERGRGGPVPVVVAPVVKKDVPIQVEAVGSVEPVRTVEIIPQVTGVVTQVHFQEGDFVKRGDLLFSIDTRPYKTALSAARAQLEKNEALARQAKQDADRFEKLAKEGIASEQELAKARANAAAMNATLESDRAQISGARLNVQFAEIRSPIDGRTGTLLINAGNVVKANDVRPLVVVRSLTPIYVRFAVPEEYLPRVRSGMQDGGLSADATPRADGGKTARGKLTFLENTVDTATGTIALKALFDNRAQELWPGQFVDVKLGLGERRGAIVAPEAAVQQGQDGAYAFVVSSGKATLRKVVLDRVIGRDAIVTSGLSPGEMVVTDGQIRLRDGAPVRIEQAPPPASASGREDPKR